MSWFRRRTDVEEKLQYIADVKKAALAHGIKKKWRESDADFVKRMQAELAQIKPPQGGGSGISKSDLLRDGANTLLMSGGLPPLASYLFGSKKNESE